MQNNLSIIRTAALELRGLDNKDIIKSAAVAKRIINWLKGFGNPEFQKKLNELQNVSPEIKSLVDNLSISIDKLNKALASTDPEGFGKAIEAVKPLVEELSVKLQDMEDKTQNVLEKAPVDGIIDTNGKYVDISNTNLEKNWSKDINKFNQMKDLLPADLDIPISRFINKNVKEFNWLQKLTPETIRVSKSSSDWIINSISKIIFEQNDISSEQRNSIAKYMKNNENFIIHSLKENISNGVLRSYIFPSSGQANKMSMIVDAGTIRIPGLGFDIQFPTVLLQDKSTTLMPVDEFELNSVKNVKARKNNESKQSVDSDIIQMLLEKNNYNVSQSAQDLGMNERSLRRKMQEFGIKRPEKDLENTDDNLELENLTASFSVSKVSLANNTDIWARNIIIDVFPKVMNRQPSESEIQTVQAVARLETFYGKGWKEAGVGSNNWGAIQCGNCKKDGKCDPATSFTHRDSTPSDTGGKTKWYVTCFKKYNSPQDGAADLIRKLFLSDKSSVKSVSNQNLTRGQLLNSAVQNSNLRGVSEAMYDTVYYEGTGANREDRIDNHMKGMQNALNAISKNTGSEIALLNNINNKSDQLQQFNEDVGNMDTEVNALINYLYASGPIEKIVKKAMIESKLPNTSLLISISNPEEKRYNRVRFAKILATALRVELCAENSIHTYGDRIEIESNIRGSESAVKKAVLAFGDSISETFEDELGVKVGFNIIFGAKSSYALLSTLDMEESFRKFAINAQANALIK